MPSSRKTSLPRVLDWPLFVALALTAAYYVVLSRPPLDESLLAYYTAEHTVEYVIVGFLLWGLCDVAFRAFSFPAEMMALKQPWLPKLGAREPVSNAAALLSQLQRKPRWLLDSRVGQRFIAALSYLKQQGSATELKDHLRYLAELDEEKSHSHYGLVRFICWVTPMLGFLGTVVHFGTALGGQEASDLGEKLPTVVAEMGTAFNTTTVALIAATTMMFCLFLCERTERGIVHTVDRLMERELLHRFETSEASIAPFLAALEAAGRANQQAMDQMLERQLQIWSGAFHSLAEQSEKRNQAQAELWEQSLARLESRFSAGQQEHEHRLTQVLNSMQQERELQRSEIQTSIRDVAALQQEFSRLVESLSAVAGSKGEVLKLQATLADNLRLLRETGQMDEALHGLTAAIHLLTARGHSASEHRAA